MACLAVPVSSLGVIRQVRALKYSVSVLALLGFLLMVVAGFLPSKQVVISSTPKRSDYLKQAVASKLQCYGVVKDHDKTFLLLGEGLPESVLVPIGAYLAQGARLVSDQHRFRLVEDEKTWFLHCLS